MPTKTQSPPTRPAPLVQERLTKEQAAEKFGNTMGMVWDEQLQEFVPLGQALVLEQLGRPVDLAQNLETFEKTRRVLMAFIKDYLEESNYDDKGAPIAGQLGDYYKVPGSEQKALTKRGASKIKQLFQWARGAARRVDGMETKEHCSATIEVPILDRYGRTVGAGIGSCNTAEKGFTSKSAINKYGGWCEWNKAKRELEIKRAADYRAALHDITSRATKRADVQATIVAAALEELFTVAREDEGDKEERDPEGRPAYPQQPPPAGSRRLPKAKKGLLATHGGKTIAELEKENRDALLKIRDWAKNSKDHGAIAEAIDEHLALATDEVLEDPDDDLPF